MNYIFGQGEDNISKKKSPLPPLTTKSIPSQTLPSDPLIKINQTTHTLFVSVHDCVEHVHVPNIPEIPVP